MNDKNENSKRDCTCSLDSADWTASGTRHGAAENADWKISVYGKAGVNDFTSQATLLPAIDQPDPGVFVLILTVVEKKGSSQEPCTKLEVSYSDNEWRPVPLPEYVRVNCGENSLTLEIEGWDP